VLQTKQKFSKGSRMNQEALPTEFQWPLAPLGPQFLLNLSGHQTPLLRQYPLWLYQEGYCFPPCGTGFKSWTGAKTDYQEPGWSLDSPQTISGSCNSKFIALKRPWTCVVEVPGWFFDLLPKVWSSEIHFSNVCPYLGGCVEVLGCVVYRELLGLLLNISSE
jgi:hypothetical protein